MSDDKDEGDRKEVHPVQDADGLPADETAVADLIITYM